MSQLVNPILFRLKKIFYWNVLYSTTPLDFKAISLKDIALYNLLLWLINNWRTEFADLYINSIRIIRYYKKTNIYLIFKHIANNYKKRRRYRRKKRFKFGKNGRLIFFKDKNKKLVVGGWEDRKKKYFNIKTDGRHNIGRTYKKKIYFKDKFMQKSAFKKSVKKKRISNLKLFRCRKWLKFKSRLYRKKKKKFIIDKLLRKKLFYASARKNKEYNIVLAYVSKIKLFFNMVRARLGIDIKFPKTIAVRSNEKKRYLLSSSFAQFIFVWKKGEIYKDPIFYMNSRETIPPPLPFSNKAILLKYVLLFINLYDNKLVNKLFCIKNRRTAVNKLVFLNKFYLHKSFNKRTSYLANLINKIVTVLIAKIKNIFPHLKSINFKIKKEFKNRVSFFKRNKKKDRYAIYEPFIRKPYNMLTYGVRDIVNSYSFGRPPKRYWFFRKVKILRGDIVPPPSVFKKKKFTVRPMNKILLFISNFYYNNINKKIYFKSRSRTHRGWQEGDINLFGSFNSFIKYIRTNYYKRSLVKKDKYYFILKNFFRFKKKKYAKFSSIKQNISYKYKKFFLLCKRLGISKKRSFKIFKNYYGFKLPLLIKNRISKKHYTTKKRKSLLLKNSFSSKFFKAKSRKAKQGAKLIKYKKESWRHWFLNIKKTKKKLKPLLRIPRHSFFNYALSKYLTINKEVSFYIKRKSKLYSKLKLSPYFNIYKKNFLKFKRRRKLLLLPGFLTYVNFFKRDFWFDFKKKKILISRIHMLKLWKKKFNYTVYKPKIKHIVFRSFLFNYLKNYKKAFLKTKNTVNIKKKIFLTFIKNPTYYIEYVRNDKTAKWTSILFYLHLGDVRARNIRELFKRNKTRHLKYLSQRLFFKNIFNRFIIKSIKKQKLLRPLRIIKKTKLPLIPEKLDKIVLPNNFRRYLGFFHPSILSLYYEIHKKLKLRTKTYKNKLYRINRITIKKFFKFFYSSEIVYMYKLKNLFYKYLYKFFKKASSFLEVHIVISHMSNSVPSSQFVVDAMLVKLFQKFRINIVLKFLLKTLSKYIDSGELDGVRVVVTGRFSRRDRSTYKIIKKDSVPLNSRFSPIDYAIGSIALRYSICVCRVWLAFKNK